MSGAVFPPILRTMAMDRRLSPTDIRVFIVATEHLDFVEYRALKVAVLAHWLRLSPSHAARAMRRLTLLGYLDRAPHTSGGGGIGAREPARYRIPHSVRGVAA